MASINNVPGAGTSADYIILYDDTWPQNTTNLLNSQPGMEDNSVIIDENMVVVEEDEEIYEIADIEPTELDGAAEIKQESSNVNDEVNLAESGGGSGDDDDEEVYMDTMEEVMNIEHLTKTEKLQAALHVKLVSNRTYELNMKKQFKEFLKTCSADIEFNQLIKLFASTVPSCNTIFVLSHDKLPENFSGKCKYAIVCSATGCENAYYRDGSDWDSIEQTKNFFGYPPDEERCTMWIKAINRRKYLKKSLLEMQTYRICEEHFTPEDFTNEFREDLLETAVPSLLLNGDEVAEEQPEIESDVQDDDSDD